MAEMCARLKIVRRYTKSRALEDPQKKTEQHNKLHSSFVQQSKEDKTVLRTALKWMQNELQQQYTLKIQQKILTLATVSTDNRSVDLLLYVIALGGHIAITLSLHSVKLTVHTA